MLDNKIEINTEDIKPLLYFIISMFQQENIHRQGTSSKNDLMGGFIDRWINKISESLIFNKYLLKDKNYSVINDYFVYGAKSKKNAPDILGLKTDKQIIKFAEYDKNEWIQIKGMPHIEIKTFRKNQRLVTVRETQLCDNNYYILVESDLDNDYLIALFNDQYLDEKILKEIEMNEKFIKNNDGGILIQPPKIINSEKDNIGSLKVLTTITGKEFKEKATKCEEGENIWYFKNVSEVSKVKGPLLEKPQKFTELFGNIKKDKYEVNLKGEEKYILPINVSDPDKIEIIKINKGSFYFKAKEKCQMGQFALKKDCLYKVELTLFERSSKWVEYMTYKDQLTEINSDDFVSLLDSIIENEII